jgi:hypothetical protein
VVFHARRWGKQTLLLVDGQGTRVPLVQEEIGYQLVRLRPSSPLQEGKRYRLEMDTGPGGAKMPPLGTYSIEGAPGPAVKLSKGMPLFVAMVVLTPLGRGLIVAVVVILIGLVLLVARRSPREPRPR